MPTFEYFCDKCDVFFEELLLQRSEVEKHRESHPCPSCSSLSKRSPVVSVSFAFKGPSGQTQGSGVHGQSGIHDLDYPSIDKAVGRSSAKKWNVYNDRKAERDSARRDFNTNSISTNSNNESFPVNEQNMKLRESANKTLKVLHEVKKLEDKKQ